MVDYISSIFTVRACRRLPCLTGSAYSAFIIKGSASRQGGIALPLSALHMKASDSCKIKDLRPVFYEPGKRVMAASNQSGFRSLLSPPA
jgi:hypothetical protein